MRRKKMGPSRPAFRSHKVTGTDAVRSATHDLLLVIRCSQGPISYHFRYKRRYSVEYLKFSPTSVYLTLSLKGFPLAFCNGGRTRKKLV